MKIQIVEPVVIVDVYCGNDGSMFLTDAGAVLACGSNRNNKLGLNNRQGFLMAMKNIFNKVIKNIFFFFFFYKSPNFLKEIIMTC